MAWLNYFECTVSRVRVWVSRVSRVTTLARVSADIYRENLTVII